MYTTLIACVTLLATAVSAAGIPGLPACAGDCLNGYGGCSQYNVTCICSNEPLIANLTCCVSKNCNAKQQQAVISFADALCAGQGGVTNLPTAATCASTAASSSTSSASSSSGSMSVTSTGSASTTQISGTKTTSAAASSSGSGGSGSSASSSAAAAASGAATTNDKLDTFGIGMVIAGLVAAL